MQNFDNFSMERDKIRKRGRTNLRVIIFVLAVVILGGALIRNETQETERKVALDGEVLLNGDISFEEADAKLREAGFVPVESDVSRKMRRYSGTRAGKYTAIRRISACWGILLLAKRAICWRLYTVSRKTR